MLPITGSGGRRWPLFTICFVIGVASSLLVANQQGVFESKPSLTADSYADRARRAADRGHFDEPSGENVKEITDAALQRWPRSPAIRGVRRQAALSLVQRARASETSPARALSGLQLALDLDPDNAEARRLLGELSPEPSVPDVLDGGPPPTKTTRSTPTSRRQPVRPAPSAETPPPPSAGTPEPPPAPGPSGGRWL